MRNQTTVCRTRRREAWTTLLGKILSRPPTRVLDVGSGTGRLAVLLAELGHAVNWRRPVTLHGRAGGGEGSGPCRTLAPRWTAGQSCFNRAAN